MSRVSLAHSRSHASSACAQRRVVQCRATRNAKDVRVGFRWDPGMSRWMRDDSNIGKVDAPVVIKPKSGAEYTVWPVMHCDLVDFGLKSIPPSEAAELQKSGWTLVDVRVEENFNYSHISGSVSIPLYRPVEGSSTFDNIKRLAMGAMAMKATERDPDFADNVLKQLGKDAKMIMVCDIGGTLKTTTEVAHKKKAYPVTDPERVFGRESRSLKATHALLEAGCKNLLHLDGGLQQWRHQGFPCGP